MKDLVEYIVKQLVTNPDDVVVDEQNEPGMVNLILTVSPQDMGIVIGKNGQTIKAIRKVLTVRAIADNVRINLQLTEVPGRQEDPSTDAQDPGEAESSADSTDTPTDTETTESTEIPK